MHWDVSSYISLDVTKFICSLLLIEIVDRLKYYHDLVTTNVEVSNGIYCYISIQSIKFYNPGDYTLNFF